MTYKELREALNAIEPNDEDELVFTLYDINNNKLITYNITKLGYIETCKRNILNFNNS